jgi:hypothetical protein
MEAAMAIAKELNVLGVVYHPMIYFSVRLEIHLRSKSSRQKLEKEVASKLLFLGTV